VDENLSLKINGLNFRLKNGQHHEAGRNPRKNRTGENFSAKLSTKTVDSFSLATAPGSVQPWAENRQTVNHGRQSPQRT
jgi:hypothetical protein